MASWARYAEGADEQGNPIDVVDRLKDKLMSAASRQREEPLAFISDREVFGDLIDNGQFVAAYTGALKDLSARGSRATLETLGRAQGTQPAHAPRRQKPSTGSLHAVLLPAHFLA